MRLVLVLVAALALAGVASAGPPAGFREAPALEPAASFVAGKPITVYCGFVRANGRTDIGGYVTSAGANDIRLSVGLACGPLERAAQGQTVLSVDFGPALGILVHEAVHARGVLDESEADCAMLRQAAEVAIRYFGMRGKRRFLRDAVAEAWAQHRGRTAAYTRLCP